MEKRLNKNRLSKDKLLKMGLLKNMLQVNIGKKFLRVDCPLLGLVICSFFGCKFKSTLTTAAIIPKRIPALKNKAPSSLTWGEVRLDSKGRILAKLLLPLDHITNFSKESRRLPECYNIFPDSFGKIGEVVCLSKAELKTTIMPSNLYQECYTNPKGPRQQPKRELTLKGCDRAEIRGDHFEPELRIDIEPLRE